MFFFRFILIPIMTLFVFIGCIVIAGNQMVAAIIAVIYAVILFRMKLPKTYPEV